VKLLLDHKADFRFATEQGVTPLMAAAGNGHGANPTRGRYKTDADAAECVRLLLDAGADVNEVASTRVSALHSAAAKGWNETVKLLAARGADLEMADSSGLRPIDHAAGRRARGFLEPETEAQKETMKILRDAIFAKTGREPLEFTPPPPGQGGAGGDPRRGAGPPGAGAPAGGPPIGGPSGAAGGAAPAGAPAPRAGG
jgi:hypothetical protein